MVSSLNLLLISIMYTTMSVAYDYEDIGVGGIKWQGCEHPCDGTVSRIVV